MNGTPRVEAVIDEVMAKHSRISPASQAEYYEEVHQHLAPLARDMEREIESLAQSINNLCLAMDGVEIAETEAQKEVACRGLAEARSEAIELLDRSGAPPRPRQVVKP